MALRRSSLAFVVAALALIVVLLARPEAPQAKANPLCDAAGSVAGGIGFGDPVGDACNAVTDGAVGTVTKPITEAVEGLGNGIFGQMLGRQNHKPLGGPGCLSGVHNVCGRVSGCPTQRRCERG